MLKNIYGNIYGEKVEHGSREVERGREREKYQKKLDWYLFDLLVTQDFQL